MLEEMGVRVFWPEAGEVHVLEETAAVPVQRAAPPVARAEAPPVARAAPGARPPPARP